MRRSTVLPWILLVAALLVIPASSRLFVSRNPVVEQRDSTFRCLVALEGLSPRSLESRLNESILHKYADDMHIPARIRAARKGENAIDSLRTGAVDLVVAYAADSLDGNGLLSSRPFGDSTVWVIRSRAVPGRRMQAINDWLTRRDASSYVRRVSRDFLKGKSVSLTSISPYDDVIRRNSEAMGWDWRLVSALIYHESRFVNESASDRGAVGLMQIVTERVSVDSLLDPAVNVEFGLKYLTRLRRMFAEEAADSTENTKFALAAFNAGEGRILDCIKFAESKGVDPTYWENIVSVLPEMPGFKGRQTIAYVRDVMETWEDYCAVYPR